MGELKSGWGGTQKWRVACPVGKPALSGGGGAKFLLALQRDGAATAGGIVGLDSCDLSQTLLKVVTVVSSSSLLSLLSLDAG